MITPHEAVDDEGPINVNAGHVRKDKTDGVLDEVGRPEGCAQGAEAKFRGSLKSD